MSKVLGLDRVATNAYPKRHDLVEGSLTMQDLDQQVQTLNRVLARILHQSK